MELEKFNNPETCREYKEYTVKWLPQNQILEGYEVSDFKVDPDSDIDIYDQVDKYVKTLLPYSKHISVAAYLRQKHFEEHISGKYIEDPDHAYWRIGINRIAEDARNKLAYWTTFRDDLLTKIIEMDQAKKIIENKRTWADVDFKIRNVDYNPKAQSKEIVQRPKISKEEKRKNRLAKKIEEEEAQREIQLHRQKENDMIENMIVKSNKMKLLAQEEFVENGGILATNLIDELMSEDKYSSEIFIIARMHPKRRVGQRILIDFESPENIYKLAGLYYDLRDNFTKMMMSDISYLFYYRDFRKAYISFAYKDDYIENNKSKEILIIMIGYMNAKELEQLRNYYSQYFSKNLKNKNTMLNFLHNIQELSHTSIIYDRLSYLESLLDMIRSDEYSEDEFEIDYDNFQVRLGYLTEMEQILYVDGYITQKFHVARRLVCYLLKLDENVYIELDKNTKKKEHCDDPSCKICNKVCFCKKCHNKFNAYSDSDSE